MGTSYQTGWDDGYAEGYACKLVDATEPFKPVSLHAADIVQRVADHVAGRYKANFSRPEALGLARSVIRLARRDLEPAKPALTADTIVQVNAFLTHMAEHYRKRTRLRRFGVTFRQMSREDAMTLALATFDASQDMTGVAFGALGYSWDRDAAREMVDDDLRHWED